MQKHATATGNAGSELALCVPIPVVMELFVTPKGTRFPMVNTEKTRSSFASLTD